MSSSSSKAPNEMTDAEIQARAKVPDGFIIAELNKFPDFKSKLDACYRKQAEFQESEEKLGEEVAAIKQLNEDVHILASIKQQIRAKITAYIARNTEQAEENNIREQFNTLVDKNPNNSFLSALHEYRLYNSSASSSSSSSISASSEDAKEDFITSHQTAVLRNGIIHVLKDGYESQLGTAEKLKLARDYYKGVIIEYLRKKFYENYQYYTGSASTNDELVEQWLLALKTKIFSEKFSGNLTTLATTTLGFKNQKEKNVEFCLLTAKQANKIISLEKLLLSNYRNFAEFEQAMIAFRDNQYFRLSSDQDSLYNALPDLAPKKADDHFPYIKDSKIKEAYGRAFNYYQRVLSDIKLSQADSTLLENFAEKIRTNLNNAIYTNFSEAAVQEFFNNIHEVMQIDELTVQAIKAIFRIFSNKNIIKDRLDSAQIDSILEERTILSLLMKLNSSIDAKNPRQMAFKDYIDSMLLQLALPPKIADIIKDPAQIVEYQAKITQYDSLQREYQQAQSNMLQLQMDAAKQIEMPIINLLRAEVLHAAKFYFNPQDAGLMHMFHHGDSGKKEVLDLITNLFNPNVKTFLDAANIINIFFARHKKDDGFHTNSFDPIFLQVLYNEGQPRGLFKMSIGDIIKLDIKSLYPAFDVDAERYKPKSANLTKQHIETLASYLAQRYSITNLKIAGSVGAMVRGDKTRLKENKRGLVRQQAAANFQRMAELLEQFKSNHDLAAEQQLGSQLMQPRNR